MTKANHILRIAELSESEGIFTTAQAERMGIPRNALRDAAYERRDFDFDKLLTLLKMKYPADLAEDLLQVLLAEVRLEND